MIRHSAPVFSRKNPAATELSQRDFAVLFGLLLAGGQLQRIAGDGQLLVGRNDEHAHAGIGRGNLAFLAKLLLVVGGRVQLDAQEFQAVADHGAQHGVVLADASGEHQRVEAAHGKAFEADSLLREAIASCHGVACFSDVIEENALVRYGKRQVPVTVMGVGPTYNSVTNIDSITVEGCFAPDRCLLGDALAGQLSVSSVSFNPNIVLYAPKRVGKINMSRPETSFVERVERVGGVFAVQQAEYDATRILAPVDSVRLLFDYSQLDVTSFAIRVDSAASPKDVARELQSVLPDGLVVKDKWQQHESFFKMMEVEKLMAFAILLFIALIAAFNIIGSMSMLIFEKKESISVLRSIGADESLVTKVFLYEGWLLSVGGAVIGLLLGVALTLAQRRWGVVGFGGDDAYIIDAYPVELWLSDVVVVFFAVVALAALAAWYPVKVIVRKYYRSA